MPISSWDALNHVIRAHRGMIIGLSSDGCYPGITLDRNPAEIIAKEKTLPCNYSDAIMSLKHKDKHENDNERNMHEVIEMLSDEAKEARNAYYREYNRNHQEQRKAIEERYWAKRAKNKELYEQRTKEPHEQRSEISRQNNRGESE